MKIFCRLATIFILIMWLFGLFVIPNFVLAQDDLATLKQKREEILTEIENVQNQLEQVQSERIGLEKEVSTLNLEIRELSLEIQGIDLTVKEMNIAIQEKEAQIKAIEEAIIAQQEILKEAIRKIDELDQTSLVEIFLGYEDMSDFFTGLKVMEDVEKSLLLSLKNIKDLRESLAEEINLLESEISGQYKLRQLRDISLGNIDNKRQEKKILIESKQGDEAALETRLEQIRQSLYDIQQYFSALVLKGTQVSTEDIVIFAREASAKTGVRTAFLLAVLETESKMGANVGKGNWQTDMPESQKQAFIQITEKLDLNPDDVPVSKKVVSSSGWRIMWGGAMGPAQFMPKTWLGYEQEIAQITGSNPPNPWNMRDALHAMALYLAKRGANNVSQETAASRAYISGSPSCSSWTCNSYASQIQKRAVGWQEYLDRN